MTRKIDTINPEAGDGKVFTASVLQHNRSRQLNFSIYIEGTATMGLVVKLLVKDGKRRMK